MMNFLVILAQELPPPGSPAYVEPGRSIGASYGWIIPVLGVVALIVFVRRRAPGRRQAVALERIAESDPSSPPGRYPRPLSERLGGLIKDSDAGSLLGSVQRVCVKCGRLTMGDGRVVLVDWCAKCRLNAEQEVSREAS